MRGGELMQTSPIKERTEFIKEKDLLSVHSENSLNE